MQPEDISAIADGRQSYARDYYRQTVATPVCYPELTENVQAQVCVIGGGLAGLTVALELARAGTSVVLLDAEVIAWGASGRNGGVVAPGYATGFDNIARRVGGDDAKALYKLSIDGVKIVNDNIEKLKIKGAQPIYGRLRVSRTSGSNQSRKMIDWMLTTFDYGLKFLDREELKKILSSEKYFHAVYDPYAFQLNVLNYALGLAQEIESLGGKIFEQSRAIAVSASDGVKVTTTPHGSVKSEHVVFAGGGYTDRVASKLRTAYVPIFTYVMVTKPAESAISTAIKLPYAVSDTRRSSDYYRVVDAGNRVLWGGMISTHGASDKVAGEALLRRMIATYPQLRSLTVERAWSGRMAYARHLMPQIGKLSDRVWYCTAFGGHGLNTTAIGAKLIAEAILNRSDEYRRFSPFGLVWNGAVAGKAAVQLTYWYLQVRDKLEEAWDRARHHD